MLICQTCGKQEKIIETLREELAAATVRIIELTEQCDGNFRAFKTEKTIAERIGEKCDELRSELAKYHDIINILKAQLYIDDDSYYFKNMKIRSDGIDALVNFLDVLKSKQLKT